VKVIEIKNLSFEYDDGTVAIKDLNLDIDQGDKIAILGPNGAGKSTLLKIIAGLMFPFKGTLNLLGKLLTKKTADELRIGLGILFQDPDDQIFMPRVWDDVAFGPINYGLSEPEVKKRVKFALRQIHMEGFEDRVPHHMSYGEKKLVAIAGILAMKPKILLLDEFTANLDPRSRQEIIRVITNQKTTMILATHDINSAIQMADKAVVLNKTKFAYGTMHEIFSDEKLLKNAHLEVPEVTKLFIELNKKGHKFDQLPLNIDEAVEKFYELTKN
jgi:cobalt/nickel transport system ATP-binding protein